MKIPIIPPSSDVEELRKALHHTDVILDAIFGFSFKPPIRTPFDAVLPLLNETRLPIVSVDIPSGWDVEQGNNLGVGLRANVLISLTAPKQGVVDFRGRHFLGGRFVPKCVILQLIFLNWDVLQ
jgi:NAD(P)H-hydrate epimerase